MPAPILTHKPYLVIRDGVTTIQGTYATLAEAEAAAEAATLQNGLPFMVYNDEAVYNIETPDPVAVRYDLTV
mgnify:CR=1 FL=1